MSVVVYTKPACPQCVATKRHLTKAKIPFVEEPLNDEIREQAVARGILSAPIVLVEGKALWGGYRPDEIDRLAAA